MTFIELDNNRYLNAEIIAIISMSTGIEGDSLTLDITTKNGKVYYVRDYDKARVIASKLDLFD